MPNTHAHVIKYVLTQDEKPIDDQDIVEIVDAVGDNIHTIQLNGNTASLVKTNIAESDVPLLLGTAATMSDDEDDHQNAIPLAKVPLSSENKVDENSSRYKIAKLEKRFLIEDSVIILHIIVIYFIEFHVLRYRTACMCID